MSFNGCEFPDGGDERIRTRLGAEGARIVLTAPLYVSPFNGTPITELVLPAFKQQMRCSPRGAHQMLRVRTTVLNRTFVNNHLAAARLAKFPYQRFKVLHPDLRRSPMIYFPVYATGTVGLRIT